MTPSSHNLFARLKNAVNKAKSLRLKRANKWHIIHGYAGPLSVMKQEKSSSKVFLTHCGEIPDLSPWQRGTGTPWGRTRGRRSPWRTRPPAAATRTSASASSGTAARWPRPAGTWTEAEAEAPRAKTSLSRPSSNCCITERKRKIDRGIGLQKSPSVTFSSSKPSPSLPPVAYFMNSSYQCGEEEEEEGF